jgi:hypothetical protein
VFLFRAILAAIIRAMRKGGLKGASEIALVHIPVAQAEPVVEYDVRVYKRMSGAGKMPTNVNIWVYRFLSENIETVS